MADSRLIPAGIRDVSTLAFNELIDRLGTVPLDQLLVYLVDNITETALPHLAEQFSVTGYDGWALTLGDTDRRSLIKRAIEIHRRKGTPWAVQQVFVALGFNGSITEWFEYEGDPYHFKALITVDDGRDITVTSLESLINLILEYKNTRSYLESVTVTAVQPGNVAVAITGITSVVITTPPLA